VVNIIHISFGIHQLDEVADDAEDVFLGEGALLGVDGESEFPVDPEAPYFTEVVALF